MRLLFITALEPVGGMTRIYEEGILILSCRVSCGKEVDPWKTKRVLDGVERIRGMGCRIEIWVLARNNQAVRDIVTEKQAFFWET